MFNGNEDVTCEQGLLVASQTQCKDTNMYYIQSRGVNALLLKQTQLTPL